MINTEGEKAVEDLSQGYGIDHGQWLPTVASDPAPRLTQRPYE